MWPGGQEPEPGQDASQTAEREADGPNRRGGGQEPGLWADMAKNTKAKATATTPPRLPGAWAALRMDQRKQWRRRQREQRQRGQGQRWRRERAGVGSMDNTHLWCLPPLIDGPCKSGSKPRQHWTLPPMRDPHSFHPRKAPGAASTQDLPPMRAWTSCASRPLLAPALRPAQAKAAGCPGQ